MQSVARFRGAKSRGAVCVWLLAAAAGSGIVPAQAAAAEPVAPKRVAAICSVWFHNSHADVIAGRLLDGYTLDDQGEFPALSLASLFLDQTPDNDKGRKLAAAHGVPIYDTVQGALTLGTGKLAVDGVLLIAEHGAYPTSAAGQVEYPKRRLFQQIVDVYDASGRAAPVFIDKHLSDRWEDAKWIYDAAQTRGFPLMAGSSLPTIWRRPAIDVPRDQPLTEIAAISYHTLDAYGFHALEMLQTIAERRAGGETGIRRVQCLTGERVWQAGAEGLYDQALFDAAFARLEHPAGSGPLPARVPQPVLFHVEYADGLKANVFTLNGAAGEWTVAWRGTGEPPQAATLFWTQEERPFGHFTHLLRGVDSMMHTGQPAWPVERTLLTSGLLAALLDSQHAGGTMLDTPQLTFAYQTEWSWQEPPAPPPGRPLDAQ